MQHFDNLDHYREEDFDDYIYYSRDSKKAHYEEELKQFYFLYEDTCGDEQELFTTIECVWKVIPPDPTTWASDLDYHGYAELTAWKVLSVENAQGDEVDPEEVLNGSKSLRDVLTEKQLHSYNADMLNFVEGV